MNGPTRQAAWSTRYGFYLVTLASAFSLGNLWRFPYIVDANRGAPFVLLYVFCALVIGLPVVIAEMMLGQAYKQGVIGAMDELSRNTKLKIANRFVGRLNVWLWIGRLANSASILLFAYYSVISGWVLYFLLQFMSGIFSPIFMNNHKIFTQLVSNGYLQIILTGVHILGTMLAVSKRLREGIERSLGLLMPLFLLLIIFLVIRSLTLPGAMQAVRFLFYPNFNDFDSGTLSSVIGHVFFTLSVGMGTIAAFGSYLRDDSNLTATSFRMVALDTVTSLFVGLMIFPIVFTSEKFSNSGPSLLFHSLPELFFKLDLPNAVGFFFFLCLYIASLASSIGLLETSVTNLVDRHSYTRRRATQKMGLMAFAIAILPALSSNFLDKIKVAGMSILLFFDTFVVDWLLPIVALGISLAVGFGMRTDVKQKLFVDLSQPDGAPIFRDWQFLLKWIVPVVILIAVISNILGVMSKL